MTSANKLTISRNMFRGRKKNPYGVRTLVKFRNVNLEYNDTLAKEFLDPRLMRLLAVRDASISTVRWFDVNGDLDEWFKRCTRWRQLWRHFNMKLDWSRFTIHHCGEKHEKIFLSRITFRVECCVYRNTILISKQYPFANIFPFDSSNLNSSSLNLTKTLYAVSRAETNLRIAKW